MIFASVTKYLASLIFEKKKGGGNNLYGIFIRI